MVSFDMPLITSPTTVTAISINGIKSFHVGYLFVCTNHEDSKTYFRAETFHTLKNNGAKTVLRKFAAKKVFFIFIQERYSLLLRENGNLNKQSVRFLKKSVKTYPRILPLVWHGYNISVKQLSPLCFRVPSIEPIKGWGRHLRVTSQPVFNDVMIELLAPQ